MKLRQGKLPIIRRAEIGLSVGLKAAGYDNAWPPPAERVLPFLHGLVGPSRWPQTELSRVVEIPLRRGIRRTTRAAPDGFRTFLAPVPAHFR